MLFAADLSQVGTCVACPGCENPVRIPLVGEEGEHLRLRRSRKYVQAGTAIDGNQVELDSGSRSRLWDRIEADGENLLEKQSLPWVWILPTFLLGLCLVGVMVSMMLGSKPVAPVEFEPVKPTVKVEVTDKAPVVAYDDSTHSKLLEESLKTFLDAKSVEEILPVIRKTAGVEAKVRTYYESRGFDKTKFKSLVRSSGLLSFTTVAAFTVQLDDYSSRDGYAELKDGKMLIDWETFVIYSEMPWDQIAEKKPTKAVEIWAFAVPSNYYNFGFKDDEWQAYELISPHEERSFIGYVKRNGPGQARLTTFGDGASGVRCVLKIKFPADAMVSNQVFIEEVVKNDWDLDINAVEEEK